jgi:methylthioribose-1-phosphate isomerase
MKVNGKHYRTIWPAEKDRRVVRIIDQRYLPHRFVVEDLTCVDDFAAAIRDMHVRGAGLIGATAGFGMYSAAVEAPRDQFDAFVQEAAAKLLATRPTAKNLAWAVDRQLAAMEAVAANKSDEPEAKKEQAFETACRIADEDAEFCRLIGQHGKDIIAEISKKKQGDTVNVLTHCNAGWLAFVDHGSATAPIYAAHREGTKVHVWVDETRPWNQGAKLTAWELAMEGVPHTLITDNAGGHLMQHGMVDLVIVGTDRTTRTGDVGNKIGTYLKALAAKDCGVPFYVALPSSTFDWDSRNGVRQIPIEERSPDEVKYVTGQNRAGQPETVLIGSAETPAANYAFDVTPARLVTGLITERGIVAAREEAIVELYPEHGDVCEA